MLKKYREKNISKGYFMFLFVRLFNKQKDTVIRNNHILCRKNVNKTAL